MCCLAAGCHHAKAMAPFDDSLHSRCLSLDIFRPSRPSTYSTVGALTKRALVSVKSGAPFSTITYYVALKLKIRCQLLSRVGYKNESTLLLLYTVQYDSAKLPIPPGD